MSQSQNLQLARELFAYFLEQKSWTLEQGNDEIAPLLDGGSEYEIDCLPGESMAAIVANLNKAIAMASEPAPTPENGRNREERRLKADRERKGICLFAQTALALIECERPARRNTENGAVAVLRGVQAMATAYLGTATK